MKKKNPPQKRSLPLNITIPTRNNSSDHHPQQRFVAKSPSSGVLNHAIERSDLRFERTHSTDNLNVKRLRPSHSFDMEQDTIQKPIILSEIPDIDNIHVDNDNSQIDSSILFSMELDQISNFLNETPVMSHETQSKGIDKKSKSQLDMSHISRFEKRADGTEIIEESQPSRHSRRNEREAGKQVRTAYALPKQPQAVPLELRSKELSLSQPGLTVDFSSRFQQRTKSSNSIEGLDSESENEPIRENETIQIRNNTAKPGLSFNTANNSYSIQNGSTKLDIQLPGGAGKAELKWTEKSRRRKHRKYRGILRSSLTIEKKGDTHLSPDFDPYASSEYYYSEDDEPIPAKIGDPTVQKPRRLDENYIHEVIEKDEHGNERVQKYISIQTQRDDQKLKSNITIDRSDRFTSKQIIVKKNLYTVQQLRDIKSELLKLNKIYSISKRSHGLILLEQLFREMQNPDLYAQYNVRQSKLLQPSPPPMQQESFTPPPGETSNQQNQQQQSHTHTSKATKEGISPSQIITRPTTIIKPGRKQQEPEQVPEESKEKFVPTSFGKAKTDDSDEERFKFAIRQAYNKLTINTIDDVNNEIVPLLVSDNKLNYAVEQFCMKAANERSFAPLYALFTSKCKLPLFREKVARDTITRFFEAIANPGKPNSETDLNLATGISAFFGSLVNEKAIQEATGHPAVVQLFEAIEKEPLHSTHIEMLHSFISNAGAEFVGKIDSRMWIKLDTVIARKDIKPRLKFLLIEVVEQKNKYAKQNADDGPIEITAPKEDSIQLVRAYFEDYKNEDQIPQFSMQATDFFGSALQLLQDYPREVFLFSRFVCEVMIKLKAYADDIVEVCQLMIKELRDNGVQDDFPGIWAAISDMTMWMMLNGVVALSDLQEIHQMITSTKWDYVNDIKWFLFFNYDFAKSLQVPGLRDDEIALVVKMPTILNSKSFEIPYMSRMIAISIVRTILTAQEKQNMPGIGQIPEKYKDLLGVCIEKQKIATLDEVDAILGMTRFFSFNVDDFIDAFEKKS